jgi:RNA polymerase sigma-70 factor (ECF subfamily)
MTISQPAPRRCAPASEPRSPALFDRDPVERVRTGDVVAFEIIMHRHNRRLFRLARSILRDVAEAEDTVQETWVRAYARLDDFVGPDGLPARLGRIAFNEALGGSRWERGRAVSLDDRVSGDDPGG